MKVHDEIMADSRAFMKSRIILTAAELNLFSRLHEKPIAADELSLEKGLDPKAVTRLLDCLITFGLIEKENGRYHTTEKGALLSSHHPETILPMVLHMNYLWNSWSRLTDTVREGVNPELKPMSERSDETVKAFIGAMHVVGRDLAGEIAAAYDLSPFRKLLDIGGASGTYTIAFLRKNPKLNAVLFDLKRVLSMADERLRAEGLRERVELMAGDFHKDELPQGCDLALLSAIIHQNGPEENLDLYRKIHQALAPGGVLLIRDHIMDETRTIPPAGAMFALNMLVMTRGGDTYTFREVEEELRTAGFTEVGLVRNGQRMDCLVEARKRT